MSPLGVVSKIAGVSAILIIVNAAFNYGTRSEPDDQPAGTKLVRDSSISFVCKITPEHTDENHRSVRSIHLLS
jgi:hypothetical protein